MELLFILVAWIFDHSRKNSHTGFKNLSDVIVHLLGQLQHEAFYFWVKYLLKSAHVFSTQLL